MVKNEFSATEIRRLLQELFPLRRLVLSQFTFFNQIGVAKPTGETFRRKRRCYRIADVLPIAVVLALKEQGIPLKNIAQVPQLLQSCAQEIFRHGKGCRLYGMGEMISLNLPSNKITSPGNLNGGHSVLESSPGELSGHDGAIAPLLTLLESDTGTEMFWGFDVGELAEQICAAAARVFSLELQRAA